MFSVAVASAFAADAVVLEAMADAYVRSGPEKENTRFGGTASLCIKRSSEATDGFHRESFLKFDLTGVKAIMGGRLWLYCPDPPTEFAAEMEIRSSSIVSWMDDHGEKSITWANRPVAGPTVLATGTWAIEWNEWDPQRSFRPKSRRATTP